MVVFQFLTTATSCTFTPIPTPDFDTDAFWYPGAFNRTFDITNFIEFRF